MENTRDSAGVFSITSSHSQEPFFLFPPPPSLSRLLLCINKFGLQTHSACFSCLHQSVLCVPEREPLGWTRTFSQNCGVLWGRNVKSSCFECSKRPAARRALISEVNSRLDEKDSALQWTQFLSSKQTKSSCYLQHI